MERFTNFVSSIGQSDVGTVGGMSDVVGENEFFDQVNQGQKNEKLRKMNHPELDLEAIGNHLFL